MAISRRSLLASAAVTGALVTAGAPSSLAAPGRRPSPTIDTRFDLVTITDDGKLALPRGFKAKRVGTIGVEDLLSDRNGKLVGKTPSNLDGTGCFDFGGRIRLVRNHECRSTADVPVPLVAGTVYDDGCPTGMGGNTVVETDARGNFVQQWVALSGTIRNCAGGETPWGSWLACEEDTTKAGTEVKGTDGKTYVTKKDHGYVFEVFPDVVAKQIPEPIKCWGRGVWEGAAIDPSRKFAYITEDTGAGLFYRWTAPEGKRIGKGIARQFGENDGVLQAAQLVKKGKALVHYGELTRDDLGKAYPVKWVDGGEDRQAQKSDLRKQFPGATVHPKIEGCWPDATGLWFTLSYVNEKEADKYGIDEDWGMVAYYNFCDQTIMLKEFYEAGNFRGATIPGNETEMIKQFHGPDNITVTPWGGVVITEDGDNPCSLISIGKRGGSREFARDLTDRGEWAGPCFNRNGSVLFASIQGDCTYAITGPIRPFMMK